MIECTRVDAHNTKHPFRVEINGVVQRNKNGDVRKFATTLGALEWAQRHLTKRARLEVAITAL